ncbi:MAG TPA: enoyl-CoA hydratase/isomerase family protein [Solirubrobacteraceae bacterium]|jgi:2-(1,2-epoxy-1,2-dihydrophenyl)acetyl-CoA isomerase|nr:enoyl-CoA hydratase/isomerase family protein [Solirubrobacteraceae bacterium]
MTISTYAEALASASAEDRTLVEVEREGSRALLRLNDPERLNPLSAALTLQLRAALSELAGDPAIRAVVLTGTDPAFSAGGDLRMMRDVARPMIDDGPDGATGAWEWIRNEFGAIAKLITRTDKAFIAAVNGAAAGVGLSFALACDMIVASEQARLVPAFGRIGLVPEVGQSWLLTRRLGYQRAFELFATGRHLTGAEAHELGLVNAVVAHEELIAKALDWCEQLDRLPAHVLKMMKPLLRNAADMTWEQAIVVEEFAEPMCFTTAVHREVVDQLLRAD